MEKHLWIRLGVTLLNITAAEEAALFGEDECAARDVIERMIAENRFHLDGETYVPNEMIEDFNREFGTAHEIDEITVYF